MLLKTPDFQYVGSLIRRVAGVVLDESRESLMGARLAAIAQQEGFKCAPDLITRLQSTSTGELHYRVVEAFLNNETWFFRHLEAFEAMKKKVIPELMAKRLAEKRLRIWSAGCASGQEPYSLSILLREHFPVLASWDVKILASDLSNNMLKRAKAGLYGQLEVNRGLPASFLLKHFEKKDLHWSVRSEVRKPVEFQRINLVQDLPALPLMDIILLRNVMIYFDVETKKTVLRRIRTMLKPDGYLFLGAAETTLMLDDGYESSVHDKVLCYRLNGRRT